MTDTRYPHLSDNILELVDWFTEQMKRQLEENHRKGDSWKDDDPDQHAYRVREEAEELTLAVSHADRKPALKVLQEFAIEEAADVANMAMFCAYRLRGRIP